MGSEEFWNNLWGQVWSPARWIQIVLVFLTLPVWFPIVRALWGELQEVLAPQGGLYGNRTPRPIRARAPGEDPFAKIPLPRRRLAARRARESRGPAAQAAAERELVPAVRRPGVGFGAHAHRRRSGFQSRV